MVDWGIACLLAATAGPKSIARTMDAANCAAVLLSVPISYHFLRLYSATGRACRRKWRYIKYTPLPFFAMPDMPWLPCHLCVSLLLVKGNEVAYVTLKICSLDV